MIYGFDSLRYNKLITVLLLIISIMPDASRSSEQSSQTTVLIIGDSLVQGFGLPEADGFVSQLQRDLFGKGQNVRIINGGVSGDSTAGGLARLDWSLTDDIDGVAISLGANDMLRGIPPEYSRENLRMMIEKLQLKELPLLLVGINSIGNYGIEYKSKFDNIFSELAEEHDILCYPNFLAPILDQNEFNLLDYFQDDKIHPNSKGVGIIVNGISPIFLDLIELIRSR